MSKLKRLFGFCDDAEAEQERSEKFDRVKEGMREVEHRVNFLEIEAELRSRGNFRASSKD